MARSAGLALAAALLALLAGCAATTPTAGPDDRTGGVTLELLFERPGNAVTRLRLERDGTLHFGGGLDARAERFSWSGPLTAAEVTAVRTSLDKDRWLTATFPAGPPSPDDGAGRLTARLRTPAGAKRIRTAGDESRIAAVYEILATAARRRHEEFLGTFPEPKSSDR